MKREEETFIRMYETVFADLYRFALCLMRHPQDAEDAVSEAVLAAYENIHKLRREEAFKSWIFTILLHICQKKLAKAAKEVHTQPEELDAQIPARETDYGLAADVRNAFFVLTQEEQAIVGLSVFGGYNSREIGRILKLNANTVRSKRSRALARMECVLR